MNLSPYDLLDLDQDASPEEIRAAWKAAIADLDPGDRRFRAYNDAAETLLDPARRADVDAELAEEAGPAPADPTAVAAEPDRIAAPTYREMESSPTPTHTSGPTASRIPAALTSGWVLAALLVVTVACAAAAAWLLTQRPSDVAVERALRTAESVAQQAAPAIFSYDHRNLDESHDRAADYMTDDYREKYDESFTSVIEQNAPRIKAVVEAEFLSSGVVRTAGGSDADDRVEVMVVFDQLTTNQQVREPQRSPAYAVLTMERVGDDWLVDDVRGPATPE